ncbi:hypothetical protein KR084_000972 [Drosophila pseudotakahashii]|nr:hypothetical protein KR084_000972 [Drosophila pseudotakahashii]
MATHLDWSSIPMGTQLLLLLMGLWLPRATAKIIPREETYEDDFVAVDFSGCAKCEENYRNFVFVLKNSELSEAEAASVYPYVACVMWLILAVLVIGQRWRKIKNKL